MAFVDGFPATTYYHGTRPAAPGGLIMNAEKVVFAFFILLALTFNFGFFLGDIDNPAHHHVYELYAALVVSLIATVMKFGDRTHVGAVLLATSLVADLQLILAAVVWAAAENFTETGMDGEMMASIVSLSGGALLANITSVVLLILETMMVRH
jgi:hypothetical protein